MVNDTVGTMMSCGYRDQSCEIGMIIGKVIGDVYADVKTGCCYHGDQKPILVTQ